MSRYYLRFVFVAVFFMASCSQKPAQIIDRGDFFYNKANSYKYSKSYKNRGQVKDGYITVTSGDTLYGIAKYYHIPAKEIARANNLKHPYKLRIGDKLKVPQMSYHRVEKGDTLFRISKTYNVKLQTLAKNNKLKKPYNLRLGQIIKLTPDIKKTNYARNYKKNTYHKTSTPKSYKKLATNQSSSIKKAKKPSIIKRTFKRFNKFTWPVQGKVVSTFGPKSGGLYNDGINIKARQGAEVRAAEDGIVAYVGNELRGYGNLIIIKHSKGWITAYAHLSKVKVKKGVEVRQGQVIANVGATGNVTFPQLYFGLRKGRDAVNPQKYLK